MTIGEWLIPIVTFLLGQLSLIIVEWARHQLTRKQQRDDARADFQRQTLLELQDTLDELARDVATVIVLQVQHARFPLKRNPVPFDDPRAQAILRAGVRLTSLAERVEDDEVRTLVIDLDAALRVAIDEADQENQANAIERFRGLRRQANERIGARLRGL